MNEEEKKAIEKVKEVIKIDKERRIVTIYDEKPLFREQLQTLLDLIEKYQNKIEGKEQVHEYDMKMIDKLKGEIVHDYICKDKIREKIKYIKSLTFEENSITRGYILTILEELLEE